MALAAQALEAQKASKPLEQGGALEQVAARMKRVMGLTKIRPDLMRRWFAHLMGKDSEPHHMTVLHTTSWLMK